MSDKVYVGPRVTGLEKGRAYEPYSRVTIWVDDEHCFTAGDDSGRELSMESPWATQAVVDRIYARIKGYVYRPFEARGADLDMAAELGDGVTVGGLYSVIAQTTEHFDALGLTDFSAPGEREVDHEYPYEDSAQRELKRRVKLGQKYQGVSITRKDGLTITETDGETEGAKVVLNSKEFAFYDAAGKEQLYFDPVAGCYKFRGALNVADNFIVDIHGNVTMKGSINLSDGSITWGGKGPVQYEFSADKVNWHPTMQANDKYRRDSLDGGTTWGDAYQFKGEDGRDGANGSDAKVTRANIERALAYAKSLGSSFMAVDSVGSPIIYGGKIFGSEIYAGGTMGSGGIVGTGSVIGLTDDGIQMSNESNDTYLLITSEVLPSIGASTALYGGGRNIYLNAQHVVIGQGVGSISAVGVDFGPLSTDFFGRVDFSHADVSGVVARFG